MRNIFCSSLAWIQWTALLTTISAADRTVPPAQFFRQEASMAEISSGPLPEGFDVPGALVWRTPIDSGQSTPIVQGGRIILTTYGGSQRELATIALDQKTGETLWRRVVPAANIEVYHPQTGSPAPATPACDGQRIYVLFGSHGLLCYDLDGKQIWDQPMGPFQDEYGAGSSPILVGDQVIVTQDHDVDSFIAAFDRKTGRRVWRTARPAAVRSYSTPTPWMRNGRTEILQAGALELAAYDPETGEKLWWVNGLARIVIPVPVPASNMIYMASWAPGADAGGRISLESWEQAVAKWDKNANGKLANQEIDDREVLSRFFRMDLDQSGDLNRVEWDRHSAVFRLAQNAVLALKPEGRGDLTESALVWKYQRGIPYVASPLLHSGILWMVKDGGIVTKLDAGNGRLLHDERLPGPGAYYASPVTGDGKVYFASEQGVVSVVAARNDWNLISSHKFNERIFATPVIDRERIYIRTEKALYCYQGRATRN